MLGCDGMYSDGYCRDGGREGDLMVVLGSDARVAPGSAAYLVVYREAFPGRVDPENREPAYFDAARVLVRAFASVLADGERTGEDRAAVVAAVQATRMDGIGGPIAFDAFGDLTVPPVTLFRFQGGAFEPVLALPFSG